MFISSSIYSYALFVWLALMTAVIVTRMLNGSIRTRGLLSTNVSRPVSPERLQLLVLTIASAASYAGIALNAIVGADTQLPAVPSALLAITGGSQAVYVAGKLVRRFRSKNSP